MKLSKELSDQLAAARRATGLPATVILSLAINEWITHHCPPTTVAGRELAKNMRREQPA